MCVCVCTHSCKKYCHICLVDQTGNESAPCICVLLCMLLAWMSVCVFCPQKMTSDTLLAPVNHLHTHPHTLTNVVICGVITRKCQFHAPLYMKTFMGLLFPYQLLVTVLPVCNGWHETLYTNTQTQLHTKTKHDLCRQHQNTQRGS